MNEDAIHACTSWLDVSFSGCSTAIDANDGSFFILQQERGGDLGSHLIKYSTAKTETIRRSVLDICIDLEDVPLRIAEEQRAMSVAPVSRRLQDLDLFLAQLAVAWLDLVRGNLEGELYTR